jgi:malate dehydrogenase (quinone)
MESKYDVAIIGAGVTGTAILYVLSKYSNVKSIALIEKYDGIAKVQSNKNNNSQTLHFGDIETHYTPEKAKIVKESAEMVRIYVEKHGNHLFKRFHKMALAVGKKEVETLRKRQKAFGKIFPKLRLIDQEELSKVEPNVVKGRDSSVELLAAFTEEGYAVDYGALSKSFVDEAKKMGKKMDLFLKTPVDSIEKKDEGYKIQSENKNFSAKVVVVAASASSLTFAHKMGYGKNLILLPVAGDFFCSPKKLNGKVYMMQNPKLPFAAIHGDPDVVNPNETRFGPIAKVLPILEKGNYFSFFDFMKLFRLRWSAIQSIFEILSEPVYYKYVFWNVLYEIPYFGKYVFLREVRKIVPSIMGSDLKYGRGIGGIRPQVVDTKTKSVAMGEAKIVKKIVDFLGRNYEFDKKGFEKDFS